MASNATAVDSGQVSAESPLIAELRRQLKEAKKWGEIYREHYNDVSRQLYTRNDEVRALKEKQEHLNVWLKLKQEMIEKRDQEKEALEKQVTSLTKKIEDLELHGTQSAKKSEPKHEKNKNRTPEDNKPRRFTHYVLWPPKKNAELLEALKDLT